MAALVPAELHKARCDTAWVALMMNAAYAQGEVSRFTTGRILFVLKEF